MLSGVNNTNNNNDVSYNKRQFWEYKRLYGGTKKNINKRQQIEIQTHKKKQVYHLVNNKIANDKTLIKRLTSIYIPPAYKNIVIAKSANNKIQAIGTDKRGRRQYVYNPQYTKKRNDRKYEDIMELGKKIVAIEQDNIKMLTAIDNKNITQWVFPDDYIPIIIYMLRTYHFRIGNEKYANDNKSFGITTLRIEHILWDRNTKPSAFTIEFIGKKGILNKFIDNNPLMVRILKKLISNSLHNNYDGYLFKYKMINNTTTSGNTSNTSNTFNNTKKITGQDVVFISPEQMQTYFQERYNAYITPKMFRTWYGNKHLLDCIRDMFNKGLLHGKTKNKMNNQEKNEIIKTCSVHVSNKLNNTPGVSKQSYIDDKILELIMKNPYKFASNIPDDSDAQHKYLYKIILKLRHI